jgi:hypothetical protein
MRYSHLAFVLLAAGCVSNAEWERRTGFQPAPMKPSDPVLIWSSGTVEKWHAVVITADSVSGIPYETSLECDTCRRSIPLGLVDSMKVRHKTGAKDVAVTSLVFAGILAAAVVAEYAVCSLVRELTGETC